MDMYGMEQIEDEVNDKKPTIEEVKKIVDSKRIKRSPSKTYTKEDRMKNLEIAREIKKKTITKPIETQKISFVKPLLEPEPNINIETIMTKNDDIKKQLNSSIDDNKIISELEKLFKNQNEYIEKIINDSKKKPIKNKIPKKIKEPTKILDLTITDNDIKNIIDNKNNKNNEVLPIKDTKLEAFLQAFQRK
jgi:hypothetical protein